MLFVRTKKAFIAVNLALVEKKKEEKKTKQILVLLIVHSIHLPFFPICL